MLRFSFFVSNLCEPRRGGAGRYLKGIQDALGARGHGVASFGRTSVARAAIDLERALTTSDVLVNVVAGGSPDPLLDRHVVRDARPGAVKVLLDLEPPATLARLSELDAAPLRANVARYDLVLVRDGGRRVFEGYEALRARACFTVHAACDPALSFPTEQDDRFAADLSLLAERAPSREAKVAELFFGAATRLPRARFVLAGRGWEQRRGPANVVRAGHLQAAEVRAFDASSRAVLVVARQPRASWGFCPPARLFEAAAAGACIVTDGWEGASELLEPGREMLVAQDGDRIARLVSSLGPQRARIIGQNARRRVLAEHTYDARARLIESILMVKGRLLS